MARGHAKNRQYLHNKLKEMFGEDFDPIIRAAEQATRLHAAAMDAEDTKVLKDSIDSWLKIGEFVMPKLKAVEYSMDDDTVQAMRSIKSSMPYEEAAQIYNDALKSDLKDVH